MTPSEILLGAADHIRQYGHQKGRFGAYGDPCCLIGAIDAVVYKKGELQDFASRDAVIALIGAELKIECDRKAITIWNDRPECTKEEVIAVLTRAGAKALSYENRTEIKTFQEAIDKAVEDHAYMIKRYNETTYRKAKQECVSWIVGCAYGYLMMANVPTGPDAYEPLRKMAQKALRKGKNK